MPRISNDVIAKLHLGQPLDEEFKYNENGLRFQRVFSQEDVNPFDMVEYELRDSTIKEPDGTVVFEMKDIEIPKNWSQVATDIMAQKYFRKTGVPQYDEDGNLKLNNDGSPMLGSETSVKQPIHRLAGTWRYWGEKYGYFASPKDAQIFYDELVVMMLKQMAAPNSPQWFNTGLNWAYGINGPAQGHYYVDNDTGELRRSEDAYTHPQPHACFIQSVKDDLVNEGGIMDLWVREARLFKYGSGTGTNFSNLRGKGEPLSGGGFSSGLMSWLKIGDRAAGAIKSGGTTRRAAKMVVVDIDHPDIEEFINWKVNEEKKVAALIAAGYSADYEGEAYQTVSGQNSNNSVRVTNDFMEAVRNDLDWHLTWRTNGKISKTLKARDLWKQIAQAAWSCADPGLQYDTTINEWHTCPKSDKIRSSNPCSEYMFIDNTACNLASFNLAKFFDTKTQTFAVNEFKHATRLWTVVLEISVLMAQFPSKEIAQGSYDFRTLGLGYANIGSLLMTMGLPYESEEAYAFTGSVTAIMTGEAYKTSAELAKFLGSFPKFDLNKEDMLRVIRNHRRAAFNVPADEYEYVSVKPKAINPDYAPTYLLTAARQAWNDALEMGERYGYRNAQTTLLAPTGTIGLLMDCDTTGVEPDFALVKFKKLSGGGYFKIVNDSVSTALQVLGYSSEQITDIIKYMKGTGEIDENTPYINSKVLLDKGFMQSDLDKINQDLKGAFNIQFVFNPFNLGEELMTRLGFKSEQYNQPDFNLLIELGFSPEEINKANDYVCGTMMIEQAPHLKTEHYPVFDCANKCGEKGQRYIPYIGHLKMMAAAQAFLSGAISKTVNMPHEATVEDIADVYQKSWELGLKAVALYRDGSKLSQPLSTKSENNSEEDEKTEDKNKESTETQALDTKKLWQDDLGDLVQKASEILTQHIPNSQQMDTYGRDGSIKGKRVYLHGEKRKVPAKRSGITVSAKIGNQQIWLRTGEYPDGKLAEIFIDMYKEGAGFRSMLNMFAISVSMGLQYGVPLEKYVDNFVFTRFEPSGFTDHPNIKNCTSVIDFVFRVLGMEYLGRTDFVQVPPKGIRKNKFENLARLSTIETGQDVLELDIKKEKTTEQKVELPQQELTNQEKEKDEQKSDVNNLDSNDQALSNMMGDAPTCPTCGHITVRNGSCYKCLNCGESLGCS